MELSWSRSKTETILIFSCGALTTTKTDPLSTETKESPDRKIDKVEIIVNQKPTSPLSADFLSSEIELNKILIDGLLNDYKNI